MRRYQYIMLSLLIVLNISSGWSTRTQEDLGTHLPSIMPFKVGFEFQESSGLCPWAKGNNNVQKKSLFYVSDSITQQKIWHVVIDTNDIEFVTRPYSNQEAQELNKCINSIVLAFEILKTLLNQHGTIQFSSWVSELSHRIEQNQCFLVVKDNYFLAENENIILPYNHRGFIFSPQVTIQHPLEYTIPLYYGLFGFDSPYMLQFNASLPMRDTLLSYAKANDFSMVQKIAQGYMQKINGLIFIHALTLVCMCPTEEDDSQALIETYENFVKYDQIDPKLKLTLMSRRPFSNMFRILNSDKGYQQHFLEVMYNNDQFINFFEVPRLFYLTNYAEQYFTSSGSIIPLNFLKHFLKQDFLNANEEIIDQLLTQGIISTAMLRNIREDLETDHNNFLKIIQDYYDIAISSVSLPENNCIIELPDIEILDTPGSRVPVKIIPSEYDILSPPLFLNPNNAMGRIKKDAKIDLRYGEAIIEVRSIKNVQPWFLEQSGLNANLSTNFLMTTDNDLTVQIEGLFRFLYNFNKQENYMNILFGLTKSVEKY